MVCSLLFATNGQAIIVWLGNMRVVPISFIVDEVFKVLYSATIITNGVFVQATGKTHFDAIERCIANFNEIVTIQD